jgi:NAD(P)-dependent dehydrogenase (short-subunit alcohol dehydrogenase family)
VPIPDGPLSGRSVIVTGAGRGIGREHALLFARHGASVVVNDLGGSGDGSGSSSSVAEEVAQEIRAEGGAAVANGDDVSDGDGAAQIVKTAIDTFGRLDVLVNNAGILRDKTLLNMSFEDWDNVMKVHLRGTFAMTQAAGRHWRDVTKLGESVAGRVINTSSGSGLFGNFGQTNYGAAKGGIASFTVIAAMELARYGVTVNAIAPVAKTRLTATAGMSLELAEGFDPLAPQNVSPFVVWLGSERSKDITGRLFSVAGGYVGVCEGWRIGSSLLHDGPLSFDLIDEEFPAVFAKAATNFNVRESHPYTNRARP